MANLIVTFAAVSARGAAGTESDMTTGRRLRFFTPDAVYDDGDAIERATAGPDVHWDILRQPNRNLADFDAAVLSGADAVVVWHGTVIDAAAIARLARCRIIVRTGAGDDCIDIAAAGAAGIAVCNTPDYGTSEVADHALALLLSLTRGIAAFHSPGGPNLAQAFDPRRAPLLRRHRGRVLGIVGLGRIGTATALRARAFGFHVIAYDPHLAAGMEIALGVERIESWREFLGCCDVISLHAPLTEETRNIVDAPAFAAMKPGAILVNTARGGLVEVDALLAALRTGQLDGAAVDVLPVEPPAADDPLTAAACDPALRGRLVVTPHAAWLSPESLADARRLSVQTALRFLRGGPARSLVNHPFLDADRMAHRSSD